MITPIKCIISILDQVKKQTAISPSLQENLEIVSNTSHLILTQVTRNIDESLLNEHKFNPNLEKHHLIEDVIIPTIEIFKVYLEIYKISIKVKDKCHTEIPVMIDKVRTQ